MKRLLLILICLIWGCCMSSCKCEEQIHIEINDNIEQMLRYLGYTDCFILDICDYSDFKITPEPVTETEIDEVVTQHLKKHPVENRTGKEIVEDGDLTIISYSIEYRDSIILSVENQVVLAGRVNFDSLIEQSVLGKTIGETYIIQYTNPSMNVNGAKCFVTPQYIYTLSDAELSDSYVRKHLDYSTVEEWKNSIREELHREKQMEAWKTALEAIIEVSFFELNQECLLDQATVLAYQMEARATIEGLTLEGYLDKAMGMSKEEFYNMCYTSCQRDIQEYLVVGAISSAEGLEVTQKEFREYCLIHNMDENGLSEENKSYVFYYILLNKVIGVMCSQN